MLDEQAGRYFIFAARGGKVVSLIRDDFAAAYRTMVRLTELGFAVAYELRAPRATATQGAHP